MSPRALSITLNARSEANRIAASVASGAQFFCHFENIGDAQAEEMFGYDVGHNFRSWPLAISPTYFNTNNAIYPHIAIPRTDRGDSLAMVVFPTVVLDLWGYETETEPMQDEDGNYIDEYGNIVETAAEAATGYVRKKKSGTDTDADPVGSEENYYIYLHGKLLAPFYRSGSLVRDWDPEIDTGRLNTDETWGEVITLEQLAREMKKKVDVEWFQRVFTIHGTGKKRVPTEWDDDGKPIEWETDDEGNIIYEGDDGERRDIKPNDMDHEITDTESMFGTWTERWLSALGIGSGSGGSGGGGGGDALDEPLLSINQMVATPTTAGQTLVWKGIGLGINGSGWDFDTAGMSQQEIQTLFDSRYLKLTSQSPQSVTSDITLNGLLTINHAQGFDPTSDLVGSNVVLTKGETLTLLDGRYVTVAFWNSLFETYNGNSPVNVNTENPIINNLKILVGTWTESYVSALGIGSGGSGGGGVWYLSQLEDVDHNSTPSNGDALVWDGQQWTFDTAGLNKNELGQYLSTNKYIKADSNTKWWGRTMNNGVVTGNIDMTLGDSIGWSLTGTSSPLSMVTLKTESSNRLFILGEGTTTNNIPTYLRGSSIYFQTISGNIDASLTKPASGDAIFYVKKLQIGSIVISEDTTNHAIHVEQNGIYADTYVSALGTGSGGGGGTPLNTLLMSLNDANVANPTSVSNQVLVCNNGQWRWEDYGGGSVTNLKTLTVKSGTTNAVVYNPADTQAATLTVSGQKVNNADVLTVTADGTAHTLTIALADNYGDTKNPYAAKSAHYVLAGPASGNATAPEFRQLAPSDISNLSLDAQTGLITIGSNTITPLTDATLKNDYVWWGGKLDATTKKREGDMSNVGNIAFDQSGRNIGGVAYFDTTANAKKLGINQSSPAYTLDVNGIIRVGTAANVIAENSTSHKYLEIGSAGNEIVVSGTGNSPMTMHVNYRASGNSKTIPSEWQWHSGSSSSWASFVLGTLWAKTSIRIGDATLTWVAGQGLKIDTGFWSESFVSALGTGSGGGGGTPLNSLLMSLNDASGVQNPTSVSNKVLVNNRGTWSWETYGGGGSGSGTIGGASDKADYFTGYVANSAAKLSPGKKINGTTFTGESDITTDKWGTARTITIKDNDATNQQANTNIDGSADFVLKLPANIKATLTGNADTATKLKTARTLWGNSFDGSQSIGYVDNNNTAHYANLNFVGSITMNSSITGCTNIDGIAYFKSSKLGINTGSTDPAYTLDVTGNIRATQVSWFPSIELSDSTPYIDFHNSKSTADYTTRIIESANGVLSIMKKSGATGLIIGGNSSATQADYIKIGGATITWDNTNQALHIDKGVYSDTYVSALGIGSGGGSGGGGMTEDQMWEALGTNGQAKQITLTHLTLALNGYAKTADVTKKLTIHQEGQDDIEYNGTAAKEITISAGGFEMKSVTNATLKGLSGTFGFYGQNLPDNDTRNYDWVGIQVGTTNDKWQLMADSGHLMVRQNDAGGSSSTGWVPASSVESSGWYTVLDSGNYKSVIGNTYSTEDTKNTAGNIDIHDTAGAAFPIYLVGTQGYSGNSGSYGATFVNHACYVGTDNYLYSNGGRAIAPVPAASHNLNFADGIGTGGIYQLHSGYATKDASWPSSYGLVANFVSTNGHLQIAASDTKNDIKIRSYWWTGNKNFGSYPEWQTLIHSGNVGTYLSGSYVDLSTNQSIAGTKTFLSGITMVSDIKPNVHKQYYVGKSDAAFLEMNANRYNTTEGGGYTHRFQTDSDGYGGLSVHGTDINALFVYVSPTKQVTLGNSRLGAGLRFYGSNSVFYAVKDGTITECLRILKSGNVCITNGISTDPGYKLYVDGTGGFTNKVTVIGNGFASKHTKDTSDAINGLEWQNTSGGCQACIQHHNTAQRVFINTIGASDVWSDSKGKYSLLIGNNELKYNTYNILHTNNGVTLDTTQDISGAKSFTSDVRCKKSNASIYVCQLSGASEVKKVGLNSDTNRGVWDFSYGAWLIGNNGVNTFLNVGNVGIGTASPSAKLHVDGSGYFSNAIGIAGFDQYHALYVNGNTRLGGLVGIGTTAQSGYNLYVNGTSYFNGYVDITKGKKIYFQHNASGVPEISIGTKSNDANLYLQGVNLYFNSSIINSSDMRLKNVDELVDGDIESIARAPIFYYRWKKTPEFGQHLGTSAQYWQNVFSCAVIKDGEGYLGLDYAATALASAVITARKVMDHEEQIAAIMRRLGDVEAENRAIKAENQWLRQEIELLKAA